MQWCEIDMNLGFPQFVDFQYHVKHACRFYLPFLPLISFEVATGVVVLHSLPPVVVAI